MERGQRTRPASNNVLTAWTARTAACGLLLAFGILNGCQLPQNNPAGQPAATLSSADTGFTSESATAPPPAAPLRRARGNLILAVLHVQVPENQAGSLAKMWNHVQENVLPDDVRMRLEHNGLRVGVGNVQFWEPIKAVLDSVVERRVTTPTPVSMPAGFPLALELDQEPSEQTLFVVAADGILTGGTWPECRKVLRVVYGPDVQHADRIVFQAVPQVQQRLEGWRWVRTEAGLMQLPKNHAYSFDAAGFSVSLAPDEFVLVAPSDARADYLVGRALLTAEIEGVRYLSFVFLRPDVTDVAQRT